MQTQCKTYAFDSNLSCHIIKKNPIVYFVCNDARNNTKRYADCVHALFWWFWHWKCGKVSPCVRIGCSRICFDIYYICHLMWSSLTKHKDLLHDNHQQAANICSLETKMNVCRASGNLPVNIAANLQKTLKKYLNVCVCLPWV